jgi:hypothetical protein
MFSLVTNLVLSKTHLDDYLLSMGFANLKNTEISFERATFSSIHLKSERYESSIVYLNSYDSLFDGKPEPKVLPWLSHEKWLSFCNVLVTNETSGIEDPREQAIKYISGNSITSPLQSCVVLDPAAALIDAITDSTGFSTFWYSFSHDSHSNYTDTMKPFIITADPLIAIALNFSQLTPMPPGYRLTLGLDDALGAVILNLGNIRTDVATSASTRLPESYAVRLYGEIYVSIENLLGIRLSAPSALRAIRLKTGLKSQPVNEILECALRSFARARDLTLQLYERRPHVTATNDTEDSLFLNTIVGE